MRECPGGSSDSAEFLEFLSLVTDAPVRHAHIEALKNGPEFYPQEVAAIRRARRAIDMEFYEFKEGKVSAVFLEALTERSQAGVEVRVVMDALGSFTTRASYFKELKAAGGQMRWYHPLRWNTWQFANNRSHRKMLIIDGHTAFVGGAGVADHWMMETRQGPPWRDTVFHLQGDAVGGLISTFSENWLEASGQILTGHKQFEFQGGHRGVPALVVSSTPSGGGTLSHPVSSSHQECKEKYCDHHAVFPARSQRAPCVGGGQRARRQGPHFGCWTAHRPPRNSAGQSS